MSRFDLVSEPPANSTFLDRYKHICIRESITPFRPALPKLHKDTLEINLDVITKNDLTALLHTLANDDSLVSIRLESHLLKNNPQLTHDIRKLHYHSNVRLPVYADPDVMSSLCNAMYRHLMRNELNLKVLRIIGIPMSEESLGVICSALPNSKALRLLSLEGIPLSARHLDICLPYIGKMLSLIILNLSNCHLGRTEIAHLAGVLRTDRKLQRLILNANPIGDHGIDLIVKAVRSNPNFRALDIQNCGLTSHACLGLQDLLDSNPLMEVCDIRRNGQISRDSALTIAKILLDNSKSRLSTNAYRSLSIDMSPPIFLDQENPPPDRLIAPPKNLPSVKLPAQFQQSQPESVKQTDFQPEKDGVFISNSLLSKLETSLIKFQVLLDYLETERLEDGLCALGNAPAKPKTEHTVKHQNVAPTEPTLRTAVQHSIVSKSYSDSFASSEQSSTRSDRLGISHDIESNSKQQKNDANRGSEKSSSLNVSSQNVNTKSYTGTNSENIARSMIERSASSKSGKTASTSSKNEKTASTASEKNVSTKSEKTVQSVSKNPTTNSKKDDWDKTITSDNEHDNDRTIESFEFNFGHIGGITRESSYLRIADEIYSDPKILESTRASQALSGDSPSPTTSRKASTGTASDLNDLQERLKKIQTRYNVVEAPLRALGKAVAEKKPRKLKIDDISISESWADDAAKGLFDLSDVSPESSFSGDLTGSDLEKF